jgi:hypothetical protein
MNTALTKKDLMNGPRQNIKEAFVWDMHLLASDILETLRRQIRRENSERAAHPPPQTHFKRHQEKETQ